jgi:acylphosphatase
MNPHYNIRVEGRVQGVFFRVSTQKEAIRLGLKGFVRNENDGSVYVEVEGPEDKIKQLLTWIGLGGPPRGEVFHYETTEADFVGFESFEIK